jgi:hypothetical protein
VDENRQETTRRAVARPAHGDQLQMRIGLLTPKNEELKRLIDGQKNKLTVPQTDPDSRKPEKKCMKLTPSR